MIVGLRQIKPEGPKTRKAISPYKYVDMAPCKANRCQSIRRGGFWASLLNPCDCGLLTWVQNFVISIFREVDTIFKKLTQKLFSISILII